MLRGSTHKKLLIPYIPLEDEIGDKVTADPSVNASVWTGESQESFLIHIIGAINYCNRTKLFEKWKAPKNERDNLQADLKESYNYVCMLEKVQENPVPTQERERGSEGQETSPERTLAGTPTSRKKTKEGKTNTPVLAEEAPSPEAEELSSQLSQRCSKADPGEITGSQ